MAGPITWRTIQSGSNHVGANLIRGAQNSFDNSFKAFDNLIQGQQQLQQNREQEAIDTQISQFKDALANKSPAEIAAAQKQGLFLRLQSGMGTDARDATRGLVGQALTQARQAETARMGYEDSLLDRTQAPLIRAAQAAIVNNDDAGFSQIMDQNPDLKNSPELFQQYQNAERARLEQGRDDQALAVRNRLDGIVTDAITGFDPKTQSVTSIRNMLRENRPDGATPAQMQEAENLLVSRLESRKGLAESDQTALDTRLTQFDDNWNEGRGIGANIYHDWKPENASSVAEELAAKYTVDGQLLGEDSSAGRLKKRNQMRQLMASGIEIGGEVFPVPREVMDGVLASSKDEGWIWNSYEDLEELTRRTMSTDFFANQLDEIGTWKKQRTNLEATGLKLYQQGNPAALAAEAAAAAPVPTTALDNAAEQANPAPVPAPGNAREIAPALPDTSRSFPAGLSAAEAQNALGEQLRNTPNSTEITGEDVRQFFESPARRNLNAQLGRVDRMDPLEKVNFLNTFGGEIRNLPKATIEKLKAVFGAQRINAYL